jgi:hypothetical protein
MENFARTTRKARLALPFRALTALDQEQESGSARSEAGGGGRLGQSEMAITQGKTPFVFGMVINIDTFLDIPAFHQPWKYIETIGVSIFNRRCPARVAGWPASDLVATSPISSRPPHI